MFKDTSKSGYSSRMDEAVVFLRESCIMLENKKKTVFEIYNELKKFTPCYFNFLPIEIKIEIVKKLVKYKNKKILESSKRFLSKSNVLISLLGRDYNYVIKSLFNKHPKTLIKENLLFNKYVHGFLEKMEVNNVAVYGWKHKKKQVLCFLDTPKYVKRFNFENFHRLTVHESETVVSRINHNNISSFKKYYTEGIHLPNRFSPIHYVNKEQIAEIFYDFTNSEV